MDYSIDDVTRITGFSKHTLRYYEKAGLLDPVDRNTGMGIQDMRLYIELLRQGDHTRVERLMMLENHHQQVLQQIAALQDALKSIEYKIDLYRKTSN